MANLNRTPSFGIPHLPGSGQQPRHLSPKPAASATVANTTHQSIVEKRGGGIPHTTKLRGGGEQRKKFLLLRPIPSTGLKNPKTGKSATPAKIVAPREGYPRQAATPTGSPGLWAGLSAAAGRGLGEPSRRERPTEDTKLRRQQYLRVPPGSPGRRRCASRRLPFPAVSVLARARSPPGLFQNAAAR